MFEKMLKLPMNCRIYPLNLQINSVSSSIIPPIVRANKDKMRTNMINHLTKTIPTQTKISKKKSMIKNPNTE